MHGGWSILQNLEFVLNLEIKIAGSLIAYWKQLMLNTLKTLSCRDSKIYPLWTIFTMIPEACLTKGLRLSKGLG